MTAGSSFLGAREKNSIFLMRYQQSTPSPLPPQLRCKEDSNYVLPEMKLSGLVPNFHIHTSVSYLKMTSGLFLYPFTLSLDVGRGGMCNYTCLSQFFNSDNSNNAICNKRMSVMFQQTGKCLID
jgi:hypothetical protein